ncbi:hypothetical protein RLOatenuis_7400 [Rickettsiales bacterium]|nr:hypothetical protein RLOatenuis_7400 [Rickettsiales bacterium]
MHLAENQIEAQDQKDFTVETSEDDMAMQEKMPGRSCTYYLGRDTIAVNQEDNILDIFVTRKFTIHSVVIEITQEEVVILTDSIFSRSPEVLHQQNNNYWTLLKLDDDYAKLISCEDLREDQERILAKLEDEIIDPILEEAGWESSCCEGWYFMW